MDEHSIETLVNSINEKNEAVQNEIEEFFCKPKKAEQKKTFKLKLEDLHFIPNFRNKADKNDPHYFQWPDAATLE